MWLGLGIGATFLNLPPAMSTLMEIYGVNYAGMSVLISAVLWTHALLQIPSGLIVDRLGIKKTTILGGILLSLGNLLPAIGTGFAPAVVWRTVLGIGTSLSFISMMKLIAVHAPGGKIGTYQAFSAGMFSMGNILSFLIIPRLLPFGWQWAYLVPGFICLIVLFQTLALHPAPEETGSVSSPSLGKIMRIRKAWVLGSYHALSWGAMLSLGNWIPTLLSEFWVKATATQLAWGGVLVMLISGLGRITGGFLLLRFSPVMIANGSLLMLMFLFTSLFALPLPGLLLVAALMAAWFSCINFGAFFHLASQAVPSDSAATMIGFVNFLANAAAVFLTLFFGFIKDETGSLSWGFGLMAILALLSMLWGWGILKGKDSNGSD